MPMRKHTPQLVLLGVVLLLLAGAAAMLKSRARETDDDAIRMAGQAGIVAELLEGTGKHLAASDAKMAQQVPDWQLALLRNSDCCSAVTSWGLGAKSLHGAVMCPDAASAFLAGNGEFVSLGPVMLNSDVFLLAEALPGAKDTELRIGVSHNRRHQVLMANEQFGGRARVVPMLPAGLPYALEKGEVDGIVIDLGFAAGEGEGGRRRMLLRTGGPVPTQELVVRRSFLRSEAFAAFSLAYEKARREVAEKYTAYGVILPGLVPAFP
jgi:hypothetical protein